MMALRTVGVPPQKNNIVPSLKGQTWYALSVPSTPEAVFKSATSGWWTTQHGSLLFSMELQVELKILLTTQRGLAFLFESYMVNMGNRTMINGIKLGTATLQLLGYCLVEILPIVERVVSRAKVKRSQKSG